MVRKLVKSSFHLTERELQALKNFAEQTERTQTEVLRDYVRSLPTYTTPLDEAKDK